MNRARPAHSRIAPQLPRRRVLPEPAQRLRLDLADPFAGDPEEPADLLQGARPAVVEPVPQLHHLAFAVAEGGEDRVEVLAEQEQGGALGGGGRVGVLDEVAEEDVVLAADRRVQGDGFAGQPQHLLDLLGAQPEPLTDLLGGRLAPRLLEQGALGAHDPVDQLHDVHRHPDGAGLVGQGAGHRLPYPPGRVRGELEAPGVVELLHRADQPEIALLHQVEHGQAAARVPLGDRDDEPQVGLDEPPLGPLPEDHQPPQVPGETGVRAAPGELRRGEHARLDAPGQLHLVGGREQRDAPDLPEVLPEEVGSGRPRLLGSGRYPPARALRPGPGSAGRGPLGRPARGGDGRGEDRGRSGGGGARGPGLHGG